MALKVDFKEKGATMEAEMYIMRLAVGLSDIPSRRALDDGYVILFVKHLEPSKCCVNDVLLQFVPVIPL